MGDGQGPGEFETDRVAQAVLGDVDVDPLEQHEEHTENAHRSYMQCSQ